MPIIGAKGSPSSGGFGQFAQSGAVNYIEDVFSTWLYNGNSTSQTITNGIDLTGKGGLVWIKYRNFGDDHVLFDTARGATNYLITNTTDPQSTIAQSLTSFNSTGFSLGSSSRVNGTTTSPANYVSWTFRKQAKFFDVVTFTSNGSGGGTFSHNLGSVPGCVIMKSTDVASSWITYHQSTGTSKYLELQSSAAQQNATNWISVDSTTVTVASGWLGANRSIVAYLFASNAGGFGLTGTDNVISCGSFTTNGSGNVSQVSLGYEPQWVLYKTTDVADNWRLVDSMRGMPVTAPTGEPVLKPNLSDAEQADAGVVVPNATGFSINGASPSFTYIYIAIRRGPMKVPTDATKVFKPDFLYGTDTNVQRYLGSVADFNIVGFRNGSAGNAQQFSSRLTGGNTLQSSSTNAEAANSITWDTNLGSNPGAGTLNTNFINYAFARAPSFFDVVCYTGNGTYAARNHNLTVAPELSITKQRDGSFFYWTVIYATSSTLGNYLSLNRTDAAGFFGSTGFTATQFGLADDTNTKTYVTYLFATCPGVSKVGSYTGTGATQTISCGFTGGARFVLIKRTDSTGDWYVWDTARGMTAGTDPSLLLNSTAAEVNANSIYTTTGGFQIVSTAAGINASGGTYIFLAIS